MPGPALDPELTRLRPLDAEEAIVRLRCAEAACAGINAKGTLDFTAERRASGYDWFGWLGTVCLAAEAVGELNGVAVAVEIRPAGVLRLAVAPPGSNRWLDPG